jgi:N-methylhydantoinase A
MLAAPLAFDFVRTAVARMDALDWPSIEALLQEMEADGRQLLARAGVPDEHIQVARAADMRLIGQAHEVTVDLDGPAPRAGDDRRIADAFERTYDRLYGRTPPDVSMQVVSWRVRVASPAPDLRLAPHAGDVDGHSRKGQRLAYFPESGGFVETPVYDRYCLRPGDELKGASIVEERESTVIIAPGARACVDLGLNLIVEV